VANGRPERSVASATLWHQFLHSLKQQCRDMSCLPSPIPSLGPFADLGCNIVFTKTSVINSLSPRWPSHSLRLAGRDWTTPLWHFPLTVEAAQVALDDALPQPPIPSPPQPAPADVVLTPRKQKHVAVSTRKQKRVSVSTRKLNRSCHAAVKQRRHKSLRRRVTFLLPAHHVDKDAQSGGVSTARSAQHIASIHARPTCQLQ